MDVEVLIATADRPSSLADTLASIREAGFGLGQFRVTVVDNAGCEATRRVCEEASARLPVRRVLESAGGKSTALNRGLELVDAPLVVFTDDDVVVRGGWIDALAAAAERWPEHSLFGGRVLPRWPGPPPKWVIGSRYSGVAFAVLDPDLEEGPHPEFRPFGPNFAVRRGVVDDGFRFDSALGPGPGDYIMGGETEFGERVVAAGRPAVFVPDSVVEHMVREEQLTLRWLLGRARKYGRSMENWRMRRHVDRSTGAAAARWLYTGIVEYAGRAVGLAALGRWTCALDSALDAAVELGRLEALR